MCAPAFRIFTFECAGTATGRPQISDSAEFLTDTKTGSQTASGFIYCSVTEIISY